MKTQKQYKELASRIIQSKRVNGRVELVDNRAIYQKKKKLCELIGGHTIQKFNIGWIPAVPGNYRAITNIAGCGPGTNGGAFFNGAQRNAAEVNNIVMGGGAAPILPGGNYPQSDVGGGALLNYAISGTITPELDHIVERNEGGANDAENARLISKFQNNNHFLPRPHAPFNGGVVGGAAGVVLRLYTPLNILQSPYCNGPIASGTNLNFAQTRALISHATGHLLHGWGGITAADIQGIQARGPGLRNGVNII